MPASLRHRERTAHDLDARIRQAEQRLVAREEDVHRRAAALLARTRSALRPKRLLAPMMGAVAGVGVLWWAFRGLGGGPARRRKPDRRGVPWLRLAGLAWPLLERLIARRPTPPR